MVSSSCRPARWRGLRAIRRPGRCPRSSHDQRRQADCRTLRRRDHQHALHALRRRLHRGFELGQGHRRASGPHRAGRRKRRRVQRWIDQRGFAQNLARDAATRSNTSVCLTLEADAALKKMVKLLETEGVAYDIGSYRDAPPGLRIWCGATVELRRGGRSCPGSTGPMPRPPAA